MIKIKPSVVIITVVLLLSVQTFATDWTHWRGPFLNGSTDETNLPSRWSKSENIAWVCPLPGPSAATPIICKGRVFVSSTDKAGTGLFALCIDAKDGKELWRKRLGYSTRKVPRNYLVTPSPVTDGKMVYFMYGSGDLAGLDYEGNVIWSRNIEKEYGNISIKYGYSSSPLIYKSKLYILVQRRHTAYRAPENERPLDSFLLAVNPQTGKNVWKQPRKTNALDESLDSYSSPIVFENNGRAEILVIAGDYATANDPETGREFWRYEYSRIKSSRWRNIPSPTTSGGLIYGVEPRGGNKLFAIKSGGIGTLSEDCIAWTFDGPTPDVSTPLYYKGNLYVLDGKNKKMLTCLDAETGEQKWQGKLGGRGPWRASLTAGDNKLYCINETTAEAVVLAADDREFKIISRANLEDGPVQSSIAISDGHLFVRTAKKLFCVGK